MSRFKIINVLDKIFVSACVFLLIYAWLNFFARNLWFSFIVSLILSGAVLFILFYILEKTQSKKAKTKKRTNDIENAFLCFKTLTKQNKLNYIKNALANEANIETFNDSLLIKNDQELYQIFISTTEKIFSEESFFSVLESRHIDTKKLIIICENFNQNINTNILKNLVIKIVDKTTFYDEYFSVANTKLDTTILTTNSKKTLQQILNNLFTPSKSKQYFFCGLILIFSSLILPYKTYYLIFGSLFLVFTILCKLQPIFSNRINGKN